MKNHKYVMAFCLLGAVGANAAPLERVALSPIVPLAAAPKKEETSKRFYEIRTYYNQRVNFVDPATGTHYYKTTPVKKKYPYYIIYDAAFACFTNNARVVTKILEGGEETPLSVIHMDHNQAINNVDGLRHITPQCVYADNLDDRGATDLSGGPVPFVHPEGETLREIPSGMLEELMSLTDFKKPVPVVPPRNPRIER